MKFTLLGTAIIGVLATNTFANPLHLKLDIDLEGEGSGSATSSGVSRDASATVKSFPTSISSSRIRDDEPVVEPTVHLPYEDHKASSSDDGFYWKFKNIPYAKPPTKENGLRFQAAQHLDPVENPPLNTGERNAVCPQSQAGWVPIAKDFMEDFFIPADPNELPPSWDDEITPADYVDISSINPIPNQSEDCLLLDVMMPKRAYKDAEEDGALYPVLVWIFGGGYIFGSKETFGPPDGLFEASALGINKLDPDSSEDFIFVAINYRVGAFGFLGGDIYENEKPQAGFENAGLSDQLVALEWVNKYIELFGGVSNMKAGFGISADFSEDNRRVTVAGESAGASSIMHHIVSNGGRGKKPPFQRAVLQSPAFFPSTSRSVLDSGYQAFLEKAGATDLADLMTKDESVLIAANGNITYNSPYGQFAYGPTVDDTYIVAPLSLSLNYGLYHRGIDVMVAHNRREGALFTEPWIRNGNQLRAAIVKAFPDMKTVDVDWVIENYPIDPEGTNKDQVLTAMYAFGDVGVDCNDYFMRKAFPNSFAYLFNIYPGYHSQDANYTFFPFGEDGPSQAIDLQAKRMQRYITAFVKYGDTITGTGTDLIWDTWAETSKVMNFGDGFLRIPPFIDVAWGMKDDTVNHTRCDWWQDAPYWRPEENEDSTKGQKLVKQSEKLEF